jgi:hypothetical protein
LSTY